ATPGSGLPSCSNAAVSPTTKISGMCWNSQILLNSNAPSVSTCSHFPAGEGGTQAVKSPYWRLVNIPEMSLWSIGEHRDFTNFGPEPGILRCKRLPRERAVTPKCQHTDGVGSFHASL